MTTISVTEARAALPDLLDRVDGGEEITITRHGRPIAVVVRPDALRVRRSDVALAAADHLAAVLARGRASTLASQRGLDRDRADELVREVRAGRRRG